MRAAALASDPAGQDPVDGAIVKAAADRGWHDGEIERRVQAVRPGDEARRGGVSRGGRCASLREGRARRRRQTGGAAESAGSRRPEAWPRAGSACSPWRSAMRQALRFAGLLGLADAVRDDSHAVVSAIRDAGVRTVMVTGDNALTARAVAEQVGIPRQRVFAGEAAWRPRR